MDPVAPFRFAGLPIRVVFGEGTLAEVGAEVARLGRRRALVLATAGHAARGGAARRHLGDAAAGVFAGAVMHTPVEVTERAVAAYRAAGADCVVAIGGGSTIGLGKAIALRTGADQVAVPTTYAGSEMTDILGETAEGRKTTRRDPAIRPETVIYDVALTLGLPRGPDRHLRPQRPRARGRGALCPRPQPDPDADGRARRSRALAAALPRARRRSGGPRRARPARSTAPGSAARCSAARRWRCTTSSATCSAAASACRTPRPTR